MFFPSSYCIPGVDFIAVSGFFFWPFHCYVFSFSRTVFLFLFLFLVFLHGNEQRTICVSCFDFCSCAFSVVGFVCFFEGVEHRRQHGNYHGTGRVGCLQSIHFWFITTAWIGRSQCSCPASSNRALGSS